MTSADSTPPSPVPLVVDLDGTLTRTDLLAETASRFLLDRPLHALKLVAWLSEGRSRLKRHLAEATRIDASVLPYNESLLAWLRAEKAKGRRLVLATASHRSLADQVAAHLGLFDEVLASEDGLNLKSRAKRDALVARYGEHGFDYVGNDWPDLAVWAAAAQAHIVGGSPRLLAAVRAQGRLGRQFDDGRPAPGLALLRAMRPHQWLKNLLILIPLLASHRYGAGGSLLQVVLAFVVFGLTASSVYLINDLVDVADDRAHERKRHRPLAAGHLPLAHAWIAWPALLALAATVSGLWMPWRFTACLAVYFLLTVAYSLALKRVPLLDVITLAALYTLRIVAGGIAIGVALSFWLLSFSMFLFLSLAFIKRYSELLAALDSGHSGALRGRGYGPQDLALVSSLGGAAGYLSVLVLALYIQDSHTAALYVQPKFIWLACPLLLYWISRAWLVAHRGQMHDDPVVFALKDRTSWVVVTLFLLAFVLAKVAA